jgi:hypothetical protein
LKCFLLNISEKITFIFGWKFNISFNNLMSYKISFNIITTERKKYKIRLTFEKQYLIYESPSWKLPR